MKNIKISFPKNCHLWCDQNLNREILNEDLEEIDLLIDESHLIRKILRCKECGQLYFYEFFELVDYKEGNDAQFWKWIPVTSEKEAEEINKMIPPRLLRIPGIRIDFPMNASQPSKPRFVLK